MTDHPVLAHLARFGIHLGLDRMRDFLAALGNPHRQFPALVVGGTNGKGSVVRYCGAVLRAAGLRVGEYTSPHLQRVNERIQVDGAEISDRALAELLDELDGVRRVWARTARNDELPEDRVLTYFEMATAAAFLHFARSGVDVAVLEVGLGGRLDAVNVVDALVTGIASIGLDHCERLGPDLSSIAAEKAGILRAERPAVLGPVPPGALRVLRTIAIERNARLVEPEAGYRVAGRNDRFSFSMAGTTIRDLAVTLDGAHQLDNAAVALAMVQSLPSSLAPAEPAIRAGLLAARNPGRLERVADDLVLDGAHNPDGAARLATWLRSVPRDRRRTLLFGASADKDARSIVAALAPCVDRVFTTRCNHPRAAEPGVLAAQLVGIDVPVLPAGPVEEALPLARDGSLVVVAGSLFLVGAVRDLVGLR